MVIHLSLPPCRSCPNLLDPVPPIIINIEWKAKSYFQANGLAEVVLLDPAK